MSWQKKEEYVRKVLSEKFGVRVDVYLFLTLLKYSSVDMYPSSS
jgi:hypothetical protein